MERRAGGPKGSRRDPADKMIKKAAVLLRCTLVTCGTKRPGLAMAGWLLLRVRADMGQNTQTGEANILRTGL